VEIQDANLVDAAASGTTVGWQLAINVAAMLVSFVALVFMANRILSWLGGFFHDTAGLVSFDLAVLAAFAVLFFVPHRTGQRDLVLWGGLAAVIAGYALLRAVASPELAWGVAVVGIGAWLPLFFAKDEPRRRGTAFWGVAFGVLLAINVAFFAGGPLPPGQSLSLQVLLGWLHWPVAFVMGVPVQDCFAVGQILGQKLVLTEFVAYADLANRLASAELGTAPALDPRSVVIVSYALCGFANIASIGIQIGGIAPLAPERRHDIARLGVKAMIGGALATFMIACVAGTFYHGVSTLGLPAR
jgi:nucleoside permease NupC